MVVGVGRGGGGGAGHNVSHKGKRPEVLLDPCKSQNHHHRADVNDTCSHWSAAQTQAAMTTIFLIIRN